MKSRWLQQSLLLVVVAAAAIGPSTAPAAEPAAEFLSALRDAGYFDTALLYLEKMESDPLTPAQFRHEIQLERALTRVTSARQIRDLALRQQTLDTADGELRKFIQSSSIHPRIYEAKSKLGNLIVERAQLEVAYAEQGSKATHMAKARQLFGQAAAMYLALQKEIKGKLSQFPKALDPVKQRREVEQRKKLRADYLQVQMMEAAVLEEHANTHNAGSAQYKQLLVRAGDRFGQIYKDYRQRYAGLYCRIYQGRCFLKVGKFNDALSYFTDIFDLSDEEPEFITMKREAMVLAFQCWLDPTMKKYAEAIDRSGQLLGAISVVERRSPEWMEIQLLSARAHQKFAAYLKAKNPRDKQITASLRIAKNAARRISRFPGPHQKAARKLLAQLGGPDLTNKRPEPKTFAQAVEAGKDALNAFTTASAVLNDLSEAKIAQVKDPEVKAEMTKNRAAAVKAAGTGVADAIEFLTLAVEMSDANSPLDEVNIVRYFLCYLYWAQQNYHEAAAVGEFVALRYPDSSGARQCAKIAMAAYLSLYDVKTAKDDRSFETNSVIRIANHITQSWPNSTEAQEALNTLIRFMVDRNELAQAKAYLEKMPKGSRYRLLAELRTGRAMWREYLNLKTEVRKQRKAGATDSDVATQTQQMKNLLSNAHGILQAAIQRTATNAPIDELYAVSALSLARIHLETGKPVQAIATLEHKRVGSLVLIKAKHSSVAAEGFSNTAYRAALKSYIQAMGQSGANVEALLAKARLAMDGMKKATTSANQGDTVGTYVAMANDLKSQMATAPPQTQNALAQGFDAFLQEIQRQSSDPNILNWVADTYRGIGEGIQQTQRQSGKDRHYFQQALSAYQKLLALSRQNTQLLKPTIARQVKARLAMTNRGLGQFKTAVNLLEEILIKNSKLLNIQIEAAKTYQAWGEVGDPRLLDRAVRGARPNAKSGKNTIWGWARISRLTGRGKRHREAFCEARLNISKCRYLQGMKTPGRKQELLKRAKRSVRGTFTAYKDLGPKWNREFDRLMKQIQAGLGETQAGIAPLLVKQKK